MLKAMNMQSRYAIIDLDAITHNFNLVKNKVGN